MSSATNFSPAADDAARAADAFAIAAAMIASSSSGANFSGFAPKVLAQTTLLPASN